MRSGLTPKVRFDKGEKVIDDKTFCEELSDQNRIEAQSARMFFSAASFFQRATSPLTRVAKA